MKKGKLLSTRLIRTVPEYRYYVEETYAVETSLPNASGTIKLVSPLTNREKAIFDRLFDLILEYTKEKK